MTAFIPYKGYWSTPFCRWQGALAHVHAFELARLAAEQALSHRGIELTNIDGGVLGMTVPQKGSFYGLPWIAGMLGAEHLAGTLGRRENLPYAMVALVRPDADRRRPGTTLVL